MAFAALVLAQSLVSLAPTIANTRSLPEALPAVDLVLEAPPLPDGASIPVTLLLPDTVRERAVSLSDGYYTRLDIHRIAGYGMLPLFILEYAAGQKLLTQGSDAPLWAEKVHKPAAYLVAGLFTLNTVTGVWNLAEAGKVKTGKGRRWTHALLMLAADAGFVYGASVAPSTKDIDARIAAGKRGGWTPHKTATVASMGVATFAYVMMYLWKDD